jgi:hypothetical protein
MPTCMAAMKESALGNLVQFLVLADVVFKAGEA